MKIEKLKKENQNRIKTKGKSETKRGKYHKNNFRHWNKHAIIRLQKMQLIQMCWFKSKTFTPYHSIPSLTTKQIYLVKLVFTRKSLLFQKPCICTTGDFYPDQTKNGRNIFSSETVFWSSDVTGVANNTCKWKYSPELFGG